MKLKQYLIIDDKDSDVEYLRKQLDKFPLFQMAAVVSTIESAIEVLAVHAIDLIFLDVRLTNQSGLTLLRSTASLPPVIITSAYPE